MDGAENYELVDIMGVGTHGVLKDISFQVKNPHWTHRW